VLLRGRSGLRLRRKARELHRSVNGFCAAVRKKDAVHTRPSGEFARERALVGVVIEVREVESRARPSRRITRTILDARDEAFTAMPPKNRDYFLPVAS